MPLNQEKRLIQINETKDKKIIDSILSDPKVYQVANGTELTAPLGTTYYEELSQKGFQYLSITYKDLVIGLFCIRPISAICLEVHTNILPYYHGIGIGALAQEQGLEWLRNNTEYESVMSYVPSNCYHMLKYMQKNCWESQGLLKDAIIYNNELCDLYMFQRGIK